ncbi:hypothetical protein ABZ930_07475 [Streptomyces sp. NPDC046716]|uniref:hypothetical protein n=1 Tax=Streptomyces sp. NPDC046716 TaxID=3157093 RepID=UPI0034047E92
MNKAFKAAIVVVTAGTILAPLQAFADDDGPLTTPHLDRPQQERVFVNGDTKVIDVPPVPAYREAAPTPTPTGHPNPVPQPMKQQTPPLLLGQKTPTRQAVPPKLPQAVPPKQTTQKTPLPLAVPPVTQKVPAKTPTKLDQKTPVVPPKSVQKTPNKVPPLLTQGIPTTKPGTKVPEPAGAKVPADQAPKVSNLPVAPKGTNDVNQFPDAQRHTIALVPQSAVKHDQAVKEKGRVGVAAGTNGAPSLANTGTAGLSCFALALSLLLAGAGSVYAAKRQEA